MKFCACIGIFTTVSAIFWLMVTLAISVRVYHNVHQCLHSKYHFSNETLVKELNIHRIDFKVITGFVTVGFHDKSHIAVTIKNSYRHPDLVDLKTFHSKVHVDKGVIAIESESPAFDFKGCQHATVAVLIPKNYHNVITLTGEVNTGSVRIHGEHNVKVGPVDIMVQVGMIKVDHVNAQSLNLNSYLGSIKVSESISVTATKLNVMAGHIYTDEFITKSFEAITTFGSSRHFDLVADNVTMKTNWGYATLVDPTSFNKIQRIDVNTVYGKSFVLLDNLHTNFTLTNKKGYLSVEYENKEFSCKVGQKTKNVLITGECETLRKMKASRMVGQKTLVNLNTDYGISTLLVEELDVDE